MTNKNYDKGASLENEVANRLNNNNYAVVRAAGSGTADRVSCDVLAINDEKILILECKTYENTGANIVSESDYNQVMEMVDRVMTGNMARPGVRGVVPALVLRQNGSFSPRYVEPFPHTYHPTGEEDLFKDLYHEGGDDE